MSAPRLSVAMPVYNGANFIAAALDSILGQSFGDFELFVSENASTDDTPDILAHYARRDRRVRVSRVEEHLAQVPNINRAVSFASGEWVKILCHDDLMRTDCLARIDTLLDGADAAGVGLIGNAERHLFPNGYLSALKEEDEPVRRTGAQAIVEALGGGSLVIPALTTATVRRSAFVAAGGLDRRYRHLVDYFCWLKLLVRWNYIFVPAALTTNRIHAGQSAAILAKQLASTQDLREFLPTFVAEHGDALGLSRSVRLRLRVRPVSESATKIAGEILGGRSQLALGMTNTLPRAWLPLLLPLIARSLQSQRAHARPLLDHVPREMIFP